MDLQVCDDHICMIYCACVTELLSSGRFLSFDLMAYYILANSFIFNFFPWPAAMDSDTVIFFTRACHTSLWIIWSYSWGQCYQSSTRYRGARHTGHEASKPIIRFRSLQSCSHFAAAILNLSQSTWDCKMVQMRSRQLCDLDNKGWCHGAGWGCLAKKYEHCWFPFPTCFFQLWLSWTHDKVIFSGFEVSPMFCKMCDVLWNCVRINQWNHLVSIHRLFVLPTHLTAELINDHVKLEEKQIYGTISVIFGNIGKLGRIECNFRINVTLQIIYV